MLYNLIFKMTKNKKLDSDLTKNKDKPYDYECTAVGSDPSVLLSKFGMFQIRSLIMISILFASLGAASVVPVFVNIIPEHECKTNYVSKPTHLFPPYMMKKSLEGGCVRFQQFFSYGPGLPLFTKLQGGFSSLILSNEYYVFCLIYRFYLNNETLVAKSSALLCPCPHPTSCSTLLRFNGAGRVLHDTLHASIQRLLFYLLEVTLFYLFFKKYLLSLIINFLAIVDQ